MSNNKYFSSSRFKMHGGGLSSSELIKLKREKHMNENIEKNNNVLLNSQGKIIGVKSYSTYMEVTRPHYVAAYTKDIISGHNMYKVINNNGTIYQRAICHLGACELIEREGVDYLENSIAEQSNIDMSINYAITVAEHALRPPIMDVRNTINVTSKTFDSSGIMEFPPYRFDASMIDISGPQSFRYPSILYSNDDGNWLINQLWNSVDKSIYISEYDRRYIVSDISPIRESTINPNIPRGEMYSLFNKQKLIQPQVMSQGPTFFTIEMPFYSFVKSMRVFVPDITASDITSNRNFHALNFDEYHKIYPSLSFELWGIDPIGNSTPLIQYGRDGFNNNATCHSFYYSPTAYRHNMYQHVFHNNYHKFNTIFEDGDERNPTNYYNKYAIYLRSSGGAFCMAEEIILEGFYEE